MEQFLWSGGAIGAPKGSQMTQNGHFVAIGGVVAPDWRNSVEYRWNKSGHIPSDALETFLGSGVPLGGSNRTPKGPQMAQNGHFGAIIGSGGCELMEQCRI